MGKIAHQGAWITSPRCVWNKRTDTIVFIRYNKIPLDRRMHITYVKTVVTYQPEKDDPNPTRLTVGGNWIVHHGNVSTLTVKMMTVKMHLNSMISTKGP